MQTTTGQQKLRYHMCVCRHENFQEESRSSSFFFFWGGVNIYAVSFLIMFWATLTRFPTLLLKVILTPVCGGGGGQGVKGYYKYVYVWV